MPGRDTTHTPSPSHSENTTRDQTGKKGGKGGEPVAKAEGLAVTAKEMEVRLDQLGGPDPSWDQTRGFHKGGPTCGSWETLQVCILNPTNQRVSHLSSTPWDVTHLLAWGWSGSLRVHPTLRRGNPSSSGFLHALDFLPLLFFAEEISSTSSD